MIRSFLYLMVILVTFFFLLILGVLFGSLIFSLTGGFINSLINNSSFVSHYWNLPVHTLALIGAVTGAVISLCQWFKIVGYVVEREHIDLIAFTKESSLTNNQEPILKEAKPFIGARDAKLGNHIMIGGIVIFLSSAIYYSNLFFIIGLIGIICMVSGFVISLAAHEYPSEYGIWRKLKLFVKNKPN